MRAAAGGRGARVLLLLLGAWMTSIVTMALLASGTFHVVEPARLANAETIYADIPEGEPRRMALRYVASEVNRFFFRRYDAVHIALAVMCCALVLRGPVRRKSMVALVACLAISIAATLWLTPSIIELGRRIDFLPRDPLPPDVAEFFRLHRMSVTGELTKLALLVGVAVGLVREGRDVRELRAPRG